MQILHSKKDMRIIRVVSFLLGLFLTLSGGNIQAESASGARSEEFLRDITPEQDTGISMTTALTLDLVVPGGGHFYVGNMYTGYFFAGAKLFAAYLIYFSYRDWIYRKSLYRAAKKANAEIDPNHELEFENPGGGYSTVDEFRRDYDRAAQRITFSVLGTAALYTASLLLTYHSVKKINERRIPTFEIGYSCGIIGHSREDVITISFNGRL